MTLPVLIAGNFLLISVYMFVLERKRGRSIAADTRRLQQLPTEHYSMGSDSILEPNNRVIVKASHAVDMSGVESSKPFG